MLKKIKQFSLATFLGGIAAYIFGEFYVYCYMRVKGVPARHMLSNDYGLAFDWVILVFGSWLIATIMIFYVIRKIDSRSSNKGD